MAITTEGELMDKIVTLCKRRGFVFQSSEIYGGFNGFWDYGPYGTAMKRAIEQLWWSEMVEKRDDVVGLDSTVICHPKVWKASGHIDRFGDIMCDCKHCKARHRVDQMPDPKVCPNCGSTDLTPPREFNLMMKTYVGPVFDDEHVAYLRAETCQPIFVDFHLIRVATRMQLPFGIAQIGKSFRNEITPGNFIFRIREFEQMELEFFCKPGTDLEWFSYWREYCAQFLYNLGISKENLRLRDHDPEELCFYSKATTDFEYLFPFGWGELWGVADRTDYDLTQHTKFSGTPMDYFDPETNERYTPYVIEPSLGADRVTLAFLIEAYDEEQLDEKDSRVVMHFHPALAPVKAAVLPLSKKLSESAGAVYTELAKHFNVEFDDAGSIGKRYRRQDEIGTPFCICYDFESENDRCVTIRDRDTMEQIRLPIDQLVSYLNEKIAF